ncbi:MAG: hypothetical protein Kow00129_08860 [Thermoleophilia bacterium]
MVIRKTFIFLIRGYQRFVSPALPRSCRYHPTCSQYAVEAVGRFGVVKGTVLAGWRLLRCNPFSYGGYDPVDRQTLFAEAEPEEALLGSDGSRQAGRACCAPESAKAVSR